MIIKKRLDGYRIFQVSIILICILLFLTGVITHQSKSIIIWLGLCRNDAMGWNMLTQNGQYWRWITYAFVHNNLNHIGSNMLGFWSLTELLRKSRTNLGVVCLVYFLSVLIGGFLQVCLGASVSIGIGASAGIMSLVSLFLAVSINNSDTKNIKLFLIIILAQIILDHIIPGVGWIAHLGGLITGFVMGIIIKP